MQLERIEPKEWKEYFVGLCYPASFGQFREPDMETISFALLVSKENRPISFCTCIEMDRETLYWQFGGAFAEIQKSHEVMQTYMMFVNYTKEHYKRATTRIENTNIPMLKMAMKCGFLIVGTWNVHGKIYLELVNEFGRN